MQNHIAHDILTLYALGADPAVLQRRYNENVDYQLPLKPATTADVSRLHDREVFKKSLGPGNGGKAYSIFLRFFQDEIGKKGWENVLSEYVFAGDDRADDMMVRLFSGFLHPIIHLGFGIEFEQPAIVAEALAKAAAHNNWLGPMLHEPKKEAHAWKLTSKPSKPLMQILEEAAGNVELKESTRWADSDKIKDGVMRRAPDEMIEIASQFFVRDESDLAKRTAEMIHACAYIASTAQRKSKQIKFDFFLIHAVNCGIFFTRFINLPSLSSATKIRLLEWKVRTDLILFVSKHSPELSFNEISDYKPRKPVSGDPWPSLFNRVNHLTDDGHASKLLRALAHAKQTCIAFEDDVELGFKIKGNMWDTIGHMAADSMESPGEMWVRGAGFDEAWKDVPAREGNF